ncbi:MAG: peptide chain release factor N(5)-glutamine methyltransferase, partial [Acidimicrobiales bacterium]
MSWLDLHRQAVERLGDVHAARWFVEEASGAEWPAVLDEPVPARAGAAFGALVSRRQSGEPVQYVLGHWAFRRLDLMVDPRVLIPRPETEVVVEVALAELARQGGRAPVVVDLGTGSGAIALSVLDEHAGARVWASDVSRDALAVASANLSGLGTTAAGRARLVQGSWWEALPAELAGRVDLAVANPPYVSEAEAAELPAEVSEWEPRQALVPGPSGLEALEAIVSGAAHWLGPGAVLVAEIAPHQAGAALGLAGRAGLAEAAARTDLAGRDRALV